jgi:hypothetical protein
LSPPGGGFVHRFAKQTFCVCAGICVGMPAIAICEAVSHRTPGGSAARAGESTTKETSEAAPAMRLIITVIMTPPQ